MRDLVDHLKRQGITKHATPPIFGQHHSRPAEALVDLEGAATLAPTKFGVWLEPDSPVTRAQSLCARRWIDCSSFVIGRRGSNRGFYSAHRPDLYVAQRAPYSVSKVHCAIEIKKDYVVIRDLNSRIGTVVNGRRFGGMINGVTEVRLGTGVHSLTLGRRKHGIRFQLTVGC